MRLVEDGLEKGTPLGKHEFVRHDAFGMPVESLFRTMPQTD